MRQQTHATDFLGLTFVTAGRRSAQEQLAALVLSPSARALVLHANLNSVYRACQHAPLSDVLRHPDALVLFEGIGLKTGLWLTTGAWRPDTNGTDLVPAVLHRLAPAPVRVALVGGAAGVAAAAAAHLAAAFPHAVVVGCWDGYDDCIDETLLLAELRTAAPDLVLLGLGTPLQEQCGARWLLPSGARVVWAVGGLLDLWAGRKRRAPAAWRFLRIEWLWRMALYPRSYGHRYAVQGLWLLGQVIGGWGRALRRGSPARARARSPAVTGDND